MDELERDLMMMEEENIVYVVGLGPGDTYYMT